MDTSTNHQRAKALEWLAVIEGGDASPVEQREFESWLSASAENVNAYNQAKGIWASIRESGELQSDADAVLLELELEQKGRDVQNFADRFASIFTHKAAAAPLAAAVLVLTVGTFFAATLFSQSVVERSFQTQTAQILPVDEQLVPAT